MSVTKSQVMDRLRSIKGLDGAGNLVDQGLVSEIIIKEDRVYFSITVPIDRAGDLEPLRQAAEKAVAGIDGVGSVTAVLTAEAAQGTAGKSNGTNGSGHAKMGSVPGAGAPAASHLPGLPGVKHIVAVASGKGGVGKSTTAVNLALGLQAMGLRVGMFDADIYGPSQPRLLGLTGQHPSATEDQQKLIPLKAYGLAVMSMGFLVEEDMPIVWRGPMVTQALNQMLFDVAWNIDGDLDVLIIDMPPGTGDVQLTMAQQVPMSGAVIVSTPQDLALIDARKGLNMFRKVDVPVIGIVENMSYFIAPDTGKRYDIFGHGGAEREAEKLGLKFLGGVPLHMDIRELSDAGTPVTAVRPEGQEAAVFKEIAGKVWEAVQTSKGIEAPIIKLAPERDSLKVTFKDGYSYDLPAEMLRVMSPSAEVQGHSAEQRVTVPGKRNVKIKTMQPVGKYATKISFDDGHNTGLYSWSYLLELGQHKDAKWKTYLEELAAKGLGRD
ncbi:MAG: P-loop NTPase [Hyphomicrobiaceae bacterium]|nr:P-loop NTPase [Hyphomicrobiaceae bacterium]MCC0007192.1 P-loop NTPase [Hyphomicrobiaceae bacterium]